MIVFCLILQKFGECSQQDATEALLKCIYETDVVTPALLDSSISQHIGVAARKRQVVHVISLFAVASSRGGGANGGNCPHPGTRPGRVAKETMTSARRL